MFQLDLIVNGEPANLLIKTSDLLLDVLRGPLGLTGAKRSCDLQVCGACAVLVDGRVVSSCSMLAVDCHRKSVATIEGLSDGEDLDVLQESFIEEGAFQCGFCTSGMIMTARAFLDEKGSLDRETIVAYLKGSICRCTGYIPIVRAIQRAGGSSATDDPDTSERISESREATYEP